MVELAVCFITIGAVVFHVLGLSLFHTVLVSMVLGLCVWCWVLNKRGVVAGSAVIVFCVTGALVVWSRQAVVQPEMFGSRVVEATVLSINKELDRTSVVVRDELFNKRIQVTVYETLLLLPGDTVSIKGIVEHPEDFVTDTGRLFEYKKYLESKGIMAVTYKSDVTLVWSGSFSIERFATQTRYVLAEVFTRFVSFPIDGITAGMLLGYQGGIPKETEELFRTTGVLHVLVLSGYNITLLAGCVGAMLRGVPNRLRMVLIFFAIVFLVLVSGAGVASIRAGVMGSIALLATLSLQQYNAFRALFISFIVFFFWSPTTLFYDPGFHLSFLATLCMITVIPKVETLFFFIPKTLYINVRELTMLAVLMPVFMLPYLMYFAGTAPLSAVPANILLGVATPAVMLFGSMVLISSFLGPLASVLGAVLSFLGTIVIRALELLSALPTYNTPGLPAWGVVAIYIIFFALLFKREVAEFIARVKKTLRPEPSSYSQ
ncbi:MAG: ComEC/Rec2 family competence protein [Minisyncoccia bacterium]